MFIYESFIKRVDRELSDDMVSSSIIGIIINFYLQKTDNCIYSEAFIKEYLEEKEIDRKIIRSIIRSNDFSIWAKESLSKKIELFFNKLDIKDNRLKIYRTIYTEYDWIEATKTSGFIKIGIYWSYKKEGTFLYSGNKAHPNKYFFSGDVSLRDVDWFKTYLFSLATLWQDEVEIRLFDNRKIKNFVAEKEGDFFVYLFSPSKIFKSWTTQPLKTIGLQKIDLWNIRKWKTISISA